MQQQQYGYPPQGQPPPPGYGHPPPPGYGPPGYPQNAYGVAPQADPRVRELNDQSTTWLIVAIAGFWIGVGFVTGPLAWIKAGRLRSEYRSLGMAPSGSATGAWIIGIVSSAVWGLVLISAIACGIMMAGAVATSGM